MTKDKTFRNERRRGQILKLPNRVVWLKSFGINFIINLVIGLALGYTQKTGIYPQLFGISLRGISCAHSTQTGPKLVLIWS